MRGTPCQYFPARISCALLSLILMLTLYLQLYKALAECLFHQGNHHILKVGEFNYWVVDHLI